MGNIVAFVATKTARTQMQNNNTGCSSNIIHFSNILASWIWMPTIMSTTLSTISPTMLANKLHVCT
jgi:hypothetical protein